MNARAPLHAGSPATIGFSLVTLILAAAPVPAAALPFSTTFSSNYLLVGNGAVNDVEMTVGVGQASNANSYELGANKAPVPSTSDFLEGGNGGGPGLAGNVAELPSNIRPVSQGITGDGNVAITSSDGVFNLQDVGLYGDLGVHCTQSAAGCDASESDCKRSKEEY